MKKNTVIAGLLFAALLGFIFSCSKRTNVHPLSPDDIFTATNTAVMQTWTFTRTRTNTPIPSTPTYTYTDTPVYSPTATPTITESWTDSPDWTHTVSPTITETSTITMTFTNPPTNTASGTATVTETISVNGPPWPYDTSTMGFTNDIYSDLACTSVTWDGNPADAKTGPGSIYGTFNFSAAANVQGYVLLDRTASPINMTGKTLNVWVNVPAAIAGKGYGLQLVAKLPGWNAKWFNLDNPGWQLFSFDVNQPNVTEVGVMISRNNSTTVYTGNIQIDEMYLSIMTPPGPPWTFDGNVESFAYKSAEPGITSLAWNSDPAGITQGAGSLAMSCNFSSGPSATGNMSRDLSPSMDFTNKTFCIWIDVPASIAGTGYGVQLYALNGSGYSWNASWFNLDNPGWQQFCWTMPATGVNDIRQIGLQILRNLSPVSYTGTIYTDDWTLTGAVVPTDTDTPVMPTATDTPIAPTDTDTPFYTPTMTATPTVTETISIGGPPWPYDTSTMGFTNDTVTDVACTSVTWDGNPADAKVGPGSIYGTFDFSASATIQGYVLLDRSASPMDFTNKTLNVWVNVPAAIAGQGYGLQLVAKLPAWNAKWFNLDTPGWQLFSFDVNAAGVTEVGVMISRNSSGVAYVGNIQIDEMYLSNMTPPGPPWTFDGNMEGFSRTADPAFTDITWNGNPAGIYMGTGSLAITTDFTSSATAQGTIQKGISPSLDLTGKVFSIWLDVPASVAGTGYGIQIVAFNGAGYAWNAQWFNLDNPGWQQFSWTVPAGLTDVRQIALQMTRNSSPVAYTGVIYTDEWTITNASAPTATDTPVIPPTPTFTVTSTPIVSAGGPPWPYDTSTMGFTNDTITDLACTSVTWDGNASHAQTGPGSIFGTFNFTASATIQGYVLLDLTASPLDLTNKTLNVWVNVPAAIAGQGYGLQVVAKDPGWNAKWFNLDNPGWQLFSFDVNAAGVTEVGVMISRNSSGVAYVGDIQIDEMYLSTMTPPGPPWTFDGNMEGFVNSGTEPGITGVAWNSNPAGIYMGAGSLALTTDFSSSATATGNVHKDVASLDLSGKTLSLWLDVPAVIAGQGWGLQVAALTGAGYAWNAQWFNLNAAGYQKFSWDITSLTDVRQIAIQILRNNSATSYTGTIYTDQWDITNTPVVSAIYNFDAGAQGWTNDTITDLAVTSLAWDSNAANAEAGAGSIVCTADFSGSTTAQGYVYVDLASSPVDLTGKTLQFWMNVPAAMVGYGAQIAYKTGAGKAWNASWENITAAGWQKFTCSPNMADVQEIGIQFLRNGAASFSGTFNLDEITYY